MTTFTNELEGQQQFFLKYLPIIDNSLTADDILTDHTDGVVRGNIIEFKLVITDLTHTLSQAIRYLSSMRIKGRSIPSNIILVSLNTETAYLYHSVDYLSDIEKVYIGSASSGIEGFSADKYLEKLEYGVNDEDEYRLISLLRSEKYTKINIDENCIVGWGERYYRENPTANKSAFIGDIGGNVKIIGEIRKPTHFKELINPYLKETNVQFQYLMDKLNDDLNKKDLGAFYTPVEYAKKSYELLMRAIERVPDGNDYIILDRCAGTGNLEENLPPEILSHCVLSTVEYYEYKVLLEVLSDKVKYIIPPTEREDTFMNGLVRGADALSEDYLNNPVLKSFIDDPKMTIIIFENPPYGEVNGSTRGKGSSASWKKSFIANKMNEDTNVQGAVKNDMANLFIWSAFKYYLRQPTDSLVVYSPIKYWKSQNLINKEFGGGFAFNRKAFHAPTAAMISCILWSNEDTPEVNDSIELEAWNLLNRELIYEGNLTINRVHSVLSEKYYDNRKFPEDTLDGIATNLDGTERIDGTIRAPKVYNDNVVGFLVANGQGFDSPRLNSGLVIANRYDSNGFILREDVFLEKLPLLSAGKYTDHENDWKIMSNIMKTGDKSEDYHNDIVNGKLDNFLLKNLLWVSLTHYAHMRSFLGSDGRLYRNQLTLDTTNGETLATKFLRAFKFNEQEKALINQFMRVLEFAKETKEYNPELTYGLYQIDKELNTYYKDIKTQKNIRNYPALHGEINSLKQNVKKYYMNEIVPTLFEYEFLK